MSHIGSSVSRGHGPDNFCGKCKLTRIRNGEQHAVCFDCLDHGPLSIDELKCSICRSWAPRHWVQATLYYPPRSQTLKDVQKLLPPVMRRASPLPPPSPVSFAGEVRLPSPPPLPESVTGGSKSGEVVMPLVTPPGQLSTEQLGFFSSLFSAFKGPQGPGLSAFLQAQVPEGQSSPSPTTEKTGKKVGGKKRSSSHKARVVSKVPSGGKVRPSADSAVELVESERGEPSSKRRKSQLSSPVGSSVLPGDQSVGLLLPLVPDVADDRGSIGKKASRSARSSSTVPVPRSSCKESIEDRGRVLARDRGLVPGPLGLVPQPTGGFHIVDKYISGQTICASRSSPDRGRSREDPV